MQLVTHMSFRLWAALLFQASLASAHCGCCLPNNKHTCVTKSQHRSWCKRSWFLWWFMLQAMSEAVRPSCHGMGIMCRQLWGWWQSDISIPQNSMEWYLVWCCQLLATTVSWWFCVLIMYCFCSQGWIQCALALASSYNFNDKSHACNSKLNMDCWQTIIHIGVWNLKLYQCDTFDSCTWQG